MAKKSSSKKSMKKVGLDFLALIFSGAIFGLLALPFINHKITTGIGESISTTSGYDLLNFEADAGVATLILLFIIFASFAVLLALTKMLIDAGVLKAGNANKIIGFGLLIMTLAILVVSIVTMIVIPSKCSSSSIGSLFSAGSYAGWLGLIFVTVSGLLSFVSSIFAIKK